MALIVEDGTGVVDANSYVTVAYVESYASLRGKSFSGTVDAQEAACARGTQHADVKYSDKFPGVRKSREQGLEWPRDDAYDKNGFNISDEVPKELMQAVAEYAMSYLDGTLPANTDNYNVKKLKSKADVVETETEFFSPGEAAANEPVHMGDTILGSFMNINSNSTYRNVGLTR